MAEWKDVAQSRGSKTNLELILEHRKMPEGHYKNLSTRMKGANRLSQSLQSISRCPTRQMASLSDIPAFEDVLGVRVMVVSSRLGNKFITTASMDEKPCIYIYLVDDMHFHSLVSITGFFSKDFFCSQCLKHYNKREKHYCDATCIICKGKSVLKPNFL